MRNRSRWWDYQPLPADPARLGVLPEQEKPAKPAKPLRLLDPAATEPAEPPCIPVSAGAKEPAKPAKPPATPDLNLSAGWADAALECFSALGVVDSAPPFRQRYPEPRGIETVVRDLGNTSTRLTLARHDCPGPNRFGQSAEQYPWCLVNMPRFRERPFDLQQARWYEDEASAFAAARNESLTAVEEVVEGSRYRALFRRWRCR